MYMYVHAGRPIEVGNMCWALDEAQDLVRSPYRSREGIVGWLVGWFGWLVGDASLIRILLHARRPAEL